MKKSTTLLLFIFLCFSLQAQQSDSTVKKKKFTFTTGITYNSGLNYYGRTDSLKSQGITSFAGITLHNGLYVFSNFIFINNAATVSYAATTLEAGYKFKNKKRQLAGKYFWSNLLL